MMFNHILLETLEPGIRIVKINRPAALNALNTETLRELSSALKEISRDQTVRVVVLTGSDRAFIAGADITEMRNMTVSEGVQFSQTGHEAAKLLENMPQPTIAAVSGFALGGGTEMALACDFVVAADTAVFGLPEVSLGVIPGFGGTFRLARFVGLPRAKELIFSGRKIKSAEAREMGLVNSVHPAADLMPKVLELAKQIANHSAGAVQRAKSLMNEFAENVGTGNKVDAEAHAFGTLMGSEDQREGMGAFSEKRKPKFQGL